MSTTKLVWYGFMHCSSPGLQYRREQQTKDFRKASSVNSGKRNACASNNLISICSGDDDGRCSCLDNSLPYNIQSDSIPPFDCRHFISTFNCSVVSVFNNAFSRHEYLLESLENFKIFRIILIFFLLNIYNADCKNSFFKYTGNTL